MRTERDLRLKAEQLQRRVYDLENNCWMPTDAEKQRAEMFKAANLALMWVLDEKEEAIK